MNSIRSVYADPADPDDRGSGSALFSVKVIGLHMPFSAVDSQGEAADWFLFLYETPVVLEVGETTGAYPGGTVVIHPPGSRILARAPDNRSDFLRTWLRFTGADLKTCIGMNGLPVEHPLCCRNPEPLVSGFMNLYAELEDLRPCDPEILQALFKILLRSILRESGMPPQTNARLRECKLHIDSHYLAPLDIDGLAKKAGYSNGHFSREYKRAFNMTPYEYIIRLRLEHAIDLLQNRNISIGKAAEESGFSDLFHFSKMFSRKMGFPPSALRPPAYARRSTSGQN